MKRAIAAVLIAVLTMAALPLSPSKAVQTGGSLGPNGQILSVSTPMLWCVNEPLRAEVNTVWPASGQPYTLTIRWDEGQSYTDQHRFRANNRSYMEHIFRTTGPKNWDAIADFGLYSQPMLMTAEGRILVVECLKYKGEINAKKINDAWSVHETAQAGRLEAAIQILVTREEWFTKTVTVNWGDGTNTTFTIPARQECQYIIENCDETHNTAIDLGLHALQILRHKYPTAGKKQAWDGGLDEYRWIFHAQVFEYAENILTGERSLPTALDAVIPIFIKNVYAYPEL